jgi:proteasome lid subunit RPN8/RPN11
MIRVARAAYDAMVEHAQEDRPFEACGVMAGSRGLITQIHRTRNVADLFGVRYEMDPKEFLRVNNAIDDADLDMIGVYHSHPFTRAYPSTTDMAQAWEGLVYVIVSLRDFLKPEARAFTIANGEVTEQPVEIVESNL